MEAVGIVQVWLLGHSCWAFVEAKEIGRKTSGGGLACRAFVVGWGRFGHPL